MTTPDVVATKPPSIFGREPALLLGLLAGVIAVVGSSVFTLSPEQQALLNALVTAVLGLIVAFRVRGGTWAAALITLVQAVFAAMLGFKFEITPDLQAGIMLLVNGIAAYATRQVVHADPPAVPGSSPVA